MWQFSNMIIWIRGLIRNFCRGSNATFKVQRIHANETSNRSKIKFLANVPLKSLSTGLSVHRYLTRRETITTAQQTDTKFL